MTNIYFKVRLPVTPQPLAGRVAIWTSCQAHFLSLGFHFPSLSFSGVQFLYLRSWLHPPPLPSHLPLLLPSLSSVSSGSPQAVEGGGGSQPAVLKLLPSWTPAQSPPSSFPFSQPLTFLSLAASSSGVFSPFPPLLEMSLTNCCESFWNQSSLGLSFPW